MTPNQGRVHDGRRKDVIDVLRQQCQVLSRQLSRRGMNVRALQPYSAGIGRAQSRKCHQRQRFAASVLPQHSDEFAAPEVQLQRVDKATARHTDTQRFTAQY